MTRSRWKFFSTAILCTKQTFNSTSKKRILFKWLSRFIPLTRRREVYQIIRIYSFILYIWWNLIMIQMRWSQGNEKAIIELMWRLLSIIFWSESLSVKVVVSEYRCMLINIRLSLGLRKINNATYILFFCHLNFYLLFAAHQEMFNWDCNPM